MEATNPGFVAGFSQSNVGDVSPNILGQYCEGGRDDGLECQIDDSTCDGKVGPCHARGPFFGLNDGGTKSCFEIGRRQYAAAHKLLQQMSASTGGSGIPVRGPVRAFHTFQDMRFQRIPLPNGTIALTCPAAMGYSFAAGTADGPGIADFKQGLRGDQPAVSPIWPILSGLIGSPTKEQKACHGIKPILLDIGELNFPYEWGPNVVDIQMLRIGQFVTIVSTGEATTMAGRRWRNAISKAINDTSLFKDHNTTAQEAPVVVIGGPANSYSHYITTEEEYQIQRYEGASTLYGPNTLAAMIHFTTQNLKYLSASPNATSGPIPAGPAPPINIDRAINLISGVSTDRTPWGKNFGDVLTEPRASYPRGSAVSVTFVGGSPRNNFRLEGTFAAVQKFNETKFWSPQRSPPSSQQISPEHYAFSPEITFDRQTPLPADANDWVTVRDDFDWDLVFNFKKVGSIFPTGEATIKWETSADTEPGTYRIVYNGDSRSSSNVITPFQGISSGFTIS